ncbi:MAG: hypothetical protein ACREJC_22655 [Tepidisphaeraceae bacterium]
MLILRIRHAEVAVADGRLDEAFELVRDPKIRSHRRGQDLVNRLVKALIERCREHLDDDRFTQALTDCEKAQMLGGDLPELLALRAEATDAVTTKRRDERLKARIVEAAREHIENGRLAAGERLLANAVNDTRAGLLMQDVGQRHALVDSVARNVSDALDRDDVDAALRELARANGADVSDKRLVELTARTAELLRERASKAIESGRLDLAESLVQRLGRLDEQSVESQQLAGVVAQCRSAWEQIDRGRPRDAEEALRRLVAVFPKAAWIGNALKCLSQADEAFEQLRTGPLGLLAVFRHDAPTQPPPAGPARQSLHGAARTPTVHAVGGGSSLPSRFMLRVDGAGSYLVLRSAHVTIGPVSSSKLPDVALIAEPNMPVAAIERSEDDYFVRGQNVAVNEKLNGNRLLTSGDRIALSPRCRVTFALPNASSTTAVLDLSGARHPHSDVRRAILLDRDLIIGPGGTSHVRADGLAEPVVLNLHEGRLICKSTALVEVNGATLERGAPIPLDAPVRVANLSFVVTRA